MASLASLGKLRIIDTGVLQAESLNLLLLFLLFVIPFCCRRAGNRKDAHILSHFKCFLFKAKITVHLFYCEDHFPSLEVWLYFIRKSHSQVQVLGTGCVNISASWVSEQFHTHGVIVTGCLFIGLS